MNLTSRRLVPIALLVTLAAGACKKAEDSSALAGDTALARDIDLANRDSSAQPQLRDVPAAAPSVRKPATKTPARSSGSSARSTAPAESTTTASGNAIQRNPSGNEGAVGTIAAGTEIALTSNDRVCTNTNATGDTFTANVTQAAVGDNGATIPAGAKALIEVTQLKRSGNVNDPIQMTFQVQNVSWNGKTFPIDAAIEHVDVDKVRNASKTSDAAKIGGGAAVGAILGQILGHNTKGTLIGAAAGAAAGTAVAMGTAGYEGCVPVGGKISAKLTQPAQISMSE